MLSADSKKFKGCEVVLPETVFYRKGKPTLLVKMDKAGCLTAIRSTDTHNLLTAELVYKELSMAGVKRRLGVKKDCVILKYFPTDAETMSSRIE